MSSETQKVSYGFGYEYCRLGRQCKTLVPLGSEELKAFEDGYARRYEEEQQLTNQCEEQENGTN